MTVATRGTARTLAAICVLVAVAVMIEPALAAGIEISVGAPGTVTVGQDVEIKAVLVQDGQPVEGAEVAVTYQAALGGESARVELASATTDETGTAVMFYQQRADDNGEMQVVYVGPEAEPVAPYTFTIEVSPSGEQLYTNQSGVSIPFVNGGLVILVISGVWFFIALAAIYIVRVGRAGRDETTEPVTASTEAGSMWISVILATAAIVTATGMVIVFVRAPVANTHLTDPHSYTRTPIAYMGTTYPYIGFGLDDGIGTESGDAATDGGVLYFEYACASCHGLSGQGAVIGPALMDEIGSFGSFNEDVREGPKGMPAYDEVTISDANLQKIYSYLTESG
ncbi:MAG: cytochrome c [Actinomycetia bacterium]|nr:cytochrome c [Actinomycetes bacterium]